MWSVFSVCVLHGKLEGEIVGNGTRKVVWWLSLVSIPVFPEIFVFALAFHSTCGYCGEFIIELV